MEVECESKSAKTNPHPRGQVDKVYFKDNIMFSDGFLIILFYSLFGITVSVFLNSNEFRATQ